MKKSAGCGRSRRPAIAVPAGRGVAVDAAAPATGRVAPATRHYCPGVGLEGAPANITSSYRGCGDPGSAAGTGSPSRQRGGVCCSGASESHVLGQVLPQLGSPARCRGSGCGVSVAQLDGGRARWAADLRRPVSVPGQLDGAGLPSCPAYGPVDQPSRRVADGQVIWPA